MTYPLYMRTSLDDRLDAFFSTAIPVAATANSIRAVAWWWSHGNLLRVEARSDNTIECEAVDADTPYMDELLAEAGADAIIDVYIADLNFGARSRITGNAGERPGT